MYEKTPYCYEVSMDFCPLKAMPIILPARGSVS